MDPQRVLGALGGNAEGHFASGSMGPKVDAALRFVENGGRQAAITSLDRVREGVAGIAGSIVHG